jgi:hypothetical protein
MSSATGGTLTTNWTAKHTAWCLLTVAAIIAVALAGAPTVVSWLVFMLSMAAFTAITADGITDRKLGILIDDRNKLSLARFQMALWTFLILSGFLAAAIGNVRAGAARPLDITIPQAVWLLMGISTTSLVGAPMILSTKRATTPTGPGTPPPLVVKTPPAAGGGPPPLSPFAPMPATPGGGAPEPPIGGASAPPLSAASLPPPPYPSRRALPASVASVLLSQGEDPTRKLVDGTVVINRSASDANWADLFKGEMVGDVATLDLAKIQMFFFTIVLVLSYAIALGTKFTSVDTARAEIGTSPVAPGKAAPPDPRRVDEFPPLDSGLVTLLGISNAGFLVNKVIPRPQPVS